MNRLRRWPWYLAAVLLAAAAAAGPARAQVDRPAMVGVIDIQGVLRASTAVQNLSAEIEAQREAAQAAIQDREEALREADLELAQRRAGLSPEAYAAERNKLENEGIELQRQLQEERRRLDQRFSQGMTQIQEVLLQISQDIAGENGLDLVLAKTTVIIVRPEFDFTDEALQRLNAVLTKVPLPAPQN
ncbi:MAG: hypothetical protein Kow00114_37510 [Kiloniellaceae bacterium]